MTDLDPAWEQMCDSLREFGRAALAQPDELDRSEGLRHTLRYLGHLADYGIEHADPARPELWKAVTLTRKFYGDGVDVDYFLAPIDGSRTYRIRGTRGTAPYLAFVVYRRGARGRVAGNLIDDDLIIGPDGSFELWLSPTPQDGPGVVTDDRCNEVVVRQYHKDRASEVDATFTIEVLDDDPGPRAPLDSAWLTKQLNGITRGLDVSLQRLDQYCAGLAKRPNVVRSSAEEGSEDFYGTSSNQYLNGWFRLGDGEALQLRFPPTEQRYFSVQLFNRWFESLEHRDHVTSLNDAQLTYDADGSATVVIGGPDGAPNRLDPCGHREGIIVVRYLESPGTPPDVTATLVRS
jgi:hypothetical protein